MELLLPTTSAYLLDASITTLRQQCEAWTSTLAFERDELAFLADLLRRKASADTIAGVIGELVVMVADLEKLQDDVVRTRRLLDRVLDQPATDERHGREAFRLTAQAAEMKMRQEAMLKRKVLDLVRTTPALPEAGKAVLQVIHERRAVRRYRPDAIPDDLVDRIIDAGRAAPSALNRQPWRFYVVTDPNLIQAMDQAITAVAHEEFPLVHGVPPSHRTDIIFHAAPVVVFLVAPKKDSWADLDTGLCAQNMMLAARALGLDTCPVGLARLITRTQFRSLLQLLPEEEVKLAVIIGKGDERPVKPARKRDNVIRVNGTERK